MNSKTDPSPAMTGVNEVKVWDPLVRILHWSLVAAFALAYVTGEEESRWHEWLGYAVLGIVVVRVIWGFIGTRHARFSDFVFRPAKVLAYTRDLLALRPPHYLGHNPLGGVMILALLVMLSITSVTGILAQEGGEGREAALGRYLPAMLSTALANGREHDDDDDKHGKGGKGEKNEWMEEIHEVAAQATLLLVFLHIAGVLVASLIEGQNLVRAMITGRKRA